MQLVNRQSKIGNGSWLPDMDLNHDKVIQSHLCYRYTIGQAGASGKLMSFAVQSRRQTGCERVIDAETFLLKPEQSSNRS